MFCNGLFPWYWECVLWPFSLAYNYTRFEKAPHDWIEHRCDGFFETIDLSSERIEEWLEDVPDSGIGSLDWIGFWSPISRDWECICHRIEFRLEVCTGIGKVPWDWIISWLEDCLAVVKLSCERPWNRESRLQIACFIIWVVPSDGAGFLWKDQFLLNYAFKLGMYPVRDCSTIGRVLVTGKGTPRSER